MTSNIKSVVVVGAGVFGVSVANHLCRELDANKYRVKLITVSDYVYFLPSAVRLTVSKDYTKSILPLKSVLDDGVEVIKEKVTGYGKRLAILPPDYVANYTNEYLSWPEPEEVSDPLEAQRLMAIPQEKCRQEGTFKRLALPA